MNRAVLFDSGRAALLLSDIECDEDGEIDKAYVVNGAWDYYCNRDGIVTCCHHRGKQVMNSFPNPGFKVFMVPADWHGDYNEIMARAEKAQP